MKMDKSSNSSSELLCCRACLATDVNLFDIHENQLAMAFESITGISVLPRDGCPQQLCGVCGVLLAKCAAFRDKCLRAQRCLQPRVQQLTTDYIETIDRLSHELVFTLALTQVEVIELGNPKQDKIKNESIDDTEYSFKTENDTLETFGLESEEPNNGTDVENILESPTDFNGYEMDENNINEQIQIETMLIPSKKVVVKKVKEEKVTKRTAEKKRGEGKSKLRNRFRFLTSEDVAQFEKEFHVDTQVLNMEQQLADWRECNARKKAPAALRCEECGKGFMQGAAYSNHKLRHDLSAGAHACAVCRVRFPRATQRRTHERQHALRLACRICGFVSRYRAQATWHYKTHTDHKFHCKHCDKSFSHRSSYLTHVRQTHAAQNVACAECGESFVSHYGLRLHHTKVHKAKKAASRCACAECGVVFDSADALAAHAHAAHRHGCDPTAKPCVACGASLPSEETLRTHAAECHSEQFQCPECPLSFSSGWSRGVHQRRAHRAGRRAPAQPCGARVCPVCGRLFPKLFQLQVHQRTHTTEKPHACTECEMRFNYKGNLQRHLRVSRNESPASDPERRVEKLAAAARALQTPRRPASPVGPEWRFRCLLNQSVHLGQRPQVKCEECGKKLGAASLATHVRFVHRKIPQKPRTRARRNET